MSKSIGKIPKVYPDLPSTYKAFLLYVIASTLTLKAKVNSGKSLGKSESKAGTS